VTQKKFFKSVARVTRTFKIEAGPFRAQGPPAILVALSGVLVAAAIARAIVTSSDRLPETLREARALAQSMRRDAPRLQP
jgi:hypothetical protein